MAGPGEEAGAAKAVLAIPQRTLEEPGAAPQSGRLSAEEWRRLCGGRIRGGLESDGGARADRCQRPDRSVSFLLF